MTRSSVYARALRRDAAVLLEDLEAGRWVPSEAERDFAEGLARLPWDGPHYRAALSQVPDAVRSSRLLDVLAPAVDVLDQAAAADIDQALVVRLRLLVDALAPAP
ncbi:hypothetical protein GCM10027168_70020 [Streptomyces capparidis]